MRALTTIFISRIGICFAIGFGISRLLQGNTLTGSMDLLMALYLVEQVTDAVAQLMSRTSTRQVEPFRF